MPTRAILALLPATLLGTAAAAQEIRDLDAHEHGTGQLDIAVDEGRLAMTLEAPGFDVVGFEHEAESDEDRAAVADALALLEDPAALFALPEGAGCTPVSAEASLVEEEEGHEEEEHHHEGEHDHDGEEAHAEHEQGAHHTEFRVEHRFDCDDASALATIGLPYFAAFPNAEELEVRIVTDAGATALEATRDAPEISLD